MSGARISVSPISTASTPDAVEVVELLARREAGLRHHRLAGGHVGEQLVGPLDVDGEVAEIAVVDADHLGLDLQRALELLLVVDLDEHVEVERPCLAVQREQRLGLERRDDQQHRVGAGGGGLVELVGVDDEVLAQHREVGRGARRHQVLERAAEVRRPR